jgi:hypothetical protein
LNPGCLSVLLRVVTEQRELYDGLIYLTLFASMLNVWRKLKKRGCQDSNLVEIPRRKCITRNHIIS